MTSVASQLIEEVTAHVQSDSLEDARDICTDGTYFPNNLRSYFRQIFFQTLYTCVFFLLRAVCPSHLFLLDLFTLIIFGEKYISLSFALCSVLLLLLCHVPYAQMS